MEWPQIVLIVLLCINFLASISETGKMVEIKPLAAAIGAIFGSGLLWFGGFWEVIKWPQIAIMVLYGFSIIYGANNSGKFYKKSFLVSFIGMAIFLFFIISGGFFK